MKSSHLTLVANNKKVDPYHNHDAGLIAFLTKILPRGGCYGVLCQERFYRLINQELTNLPEYIRKNNVPVQLFASHPQRISLPQFKDTNGIVWTVESIYWDEGEQGGKFLVSSLHPTDETPSTGKREINTVYFLQHTAMPITHWHYLGLWLGTLFGK